MAKKTYRISFVTGFVAYMELNHYELRKMIKDKDNRVNGYQLA